MRRRDFLQLAAGASAFTALVPAAARAQAWPARPVKLIVPFAAGGATDLLARPWAEALGKAFGQQFVIENRGGASGLIGAEAAFRSAADGYTYLFSSNSPTVFQPQLRKINYDSKQFVQVARMGDSISGFVVHPKHGFKTLKDMIDYAKANPGKLNFGSSGAGTTTHMRLEALKFKTGIDILHVPYRGGADSLTDLLAGVIDIMNEGATLPHAKAGKLTLLNVNHHERFAEFPDVPTLTEAGVKDADVPVWFGLYAPPGTPKDIVEKLNAKINEISATPEMKETMQKASAVPVVQNLADLQKHFDDDYKYIGDLIKSANIKIE
ncbi:MAG TPA: tripartite tricarboxylate transporter substrate binding protein [Hyphomicrobiaceae bacterium]|nr:tripartite tricarboxylate transporter substrate binding protein [Hyphomicrobiaceae bacterium]